MEVVFFPISAEIGGFLRSHTNIEEGWNTGTFRLNSEDGNVFLLDFFLSLFAGIVLFGKD